jgi:hypothetical protein
MGTDDVRLKQGIKVLRNEFDLFGSRPGFESRGQPVMAVRTNPDFPGASRTLRLECDGIFA